MNYISVWDICLHGFNHYSRAFLFWVLNGLWEFVSIFFFASMYLNSEFYLKPNHKDFEHLITFKAHELGLIFRTCKQTYIDFLTTNYDSYITQWTHIFGRFFETGSDKISSSYLTTMSTSSSAGFVLSYDIVKTHRGELEIISDKSEGVEFKIILAL